MANYSDSQLTAAAQNLANRPPHQNPALSPSAMATVHPDAKPIVQAVLNSPKHRAIAQGANPAAGTNALDPHQQKRNPHNRVQLLGFNSQAIGSAATSGVTATPYENFTGKRMVVSGVTIGAGIVGSSVSNVQVGIVPVFAALGGEPIDSFAAGLTGGFTEFPTATPAIGISAQVTLPASATFYGAIIGTSTKRKDANRPPQQYSKVQRLPIAQTAVAQTGAFNVVVTPTLPFWGRKIVLSDFQAAVPGNVLGTSATGATAGMSQTNINALSVGVNPQFLNLPSNSAPVPAATFNALAEHMWLDFDMADTAVPYTFQCQPVGTGSVYFGGVIEGDIDMRSISGSGYSNAA